MKTKISTFFLAAFMLLALNTKATTVVVGPTGTYYSINKAITELNTSGPITEPLLIELQQAYNRPDTIIAVNGASVSNTVTIRPEATATDIQVKYAGAGADSIVWLMDACKYVTIDGRAGGAGAIVMTITADTLVGTSPTTRLKKQSAIRFINDASFNTVQYLKLRSATTLGMWRIGTTLPVFKGTIEFRDGITTGNSYNTIDNCDLGPIHAFTGTPSTAIFSKGILAAPNTNLTISNNKIYDYFATDLNKANGLGIQVGSGAGVLLGANTSVCTISGNSFYQTEQRTTYGNGNGAKTGAIIIDNNINGNGFIVKNNYIGGSEPLCAGANRYWVTTGNNTGFNGIYISTLATGATSYVYGNTVKNIYLFASSAIAQVYKSAGISINGGKALVGIDEYGAANGNTIGDVSPTAVGPLNASIIFTGGANNSCFAGFTFNSLAGADVKIANNKVAGYYQKAHTVAFGGNFIGIDIVGTAQSSLVVENNEIGNGAVGITDPTLMSIQNFQGAKCFGIYMNSAGAAASTLEIKNNKINNIYKGTEGITINVLHGIWINSAVLCPVKISNNVIRDLVYSSPLAVPTPINWASGITCASQGASSVIENNTIYNIEGIDRVSTNAVGIVAMSTVSTTTMDVKNNLIYNLTSNMPRKNNANLTGLTGILTHGVTAAVTPTFNVYNNMIRLGQNRAGNNITTSNTMIGIRDSIVSTGAVKANYYNNTILIGGDNTIANDSLPTYGMYLCTSATNAVVRNIKNNLIINNHSVALTGANHYAIATGVAALITASNTFNNNDYYAGGTTGILGRFTSGATTNTLAGIQGFTGGDASSVNINPVFISANGTTPNLHLNQSNFNVNEGLKYAAVLSAPFDLDFDGGARHLSNPTIGADEYNGYVTATNSTEKNSMLVAVNGRQLIISGIVAGELISVVSMNGQLVTKQLATASQTTIQLKSGVYIVKAGNKVQKVIL